MDYIVEENGYGSIRFLLIDNGEIIDRKWTSTNSYFVRNIRKYLWRWSRVREGDDLECEIDLEINKKFIEFLFKQKDDGGVLKEVYNVNDMMTGLEILEINTIADGIIA